MMYLPKDPQKNMRLLEKLELKLSSYSYVYNILNNQQSLSLNKRCLPLYDVQALIKRLEKYEFVRIGTARLEVVPPHYGIDFIDEEHAVLKELISAYDDRKQLLSDISKIVQIFFMKQKIWKN